MASIITSKTRGIARPVPAWPFCVNPDVAAEYGIIFLTMPYSAGCKDLSRFNAGWLTPTGTPDVQMSFNGGRAWNLASGEYFTLTKDFPTPPYSMWCWAASDNIYSDTGIMGMYEDSSNYWTIYINSESVPATTAMLRHSQNPWEQYAEVTTAPSHAMSGEYHLFGSSLYVDSGDDMWVNAWFDDITTAYSELTRNWVTLPTFHIGVKMGDPEYFDGKIALVAISGKLLTAKQQYALWHPTTRWDLIHELDRKSTHIIGTTEEEAPTEEEVDLTAATASASAEAVIHESPLVVAAATAAAETVTPKLAVTLSVATAAAAAENTTVSEFLVDLAVATAAATAEDITASELHVDLSIATAAAAANSLAHESPITTATASASANNVTQALTATLSVATASAAAEDITASEFLVDLAIAAATAAAEDVQGQLDQVGGTLTTAAATASANSLSYEAPLVIAAATAAAEDITASELHVNLTVATCSAGAEDMTASEFHVSLSAASGSASANELVVKAPLTTAAATGAAEDVSGGLSGYQISTATAAAAANDVVHQCVLVIATASASGVDINGPGEAAAPTEDYHLMPRKRFEDYGLGEVWISREQTTVRDLGYGNVPRPRKR